MPNLHDRSCDYCHAPQGVSFPIQNVSEMTTMVDRIACIYVVHSVSTSHRSEIIYHGY